MGRGFQGLGICILQNLLWLDLAIRNAAALIEGNLYNRIVRRLRDLLPHFNLEDLTDIKPPQRSPLERSLPETLYINPIHIHI